MSHVFHCRLITPRVRRVRGHAEGVDRSCLVETNGFLAEPIAIALGKFFDRLAAKTGTIDVDPPLLAFEQNPIAGSVRDHHARSVGELQCHVELGGRVEAVGQLRLAGEEGDRIKVVGNQGESASALDLDRARFVVPERPLGDVQMVSAPVGQFSAGILQPPAKGAVAALGREGNLRALAEPRVPVQVWRRGFRRERPAGWVPLPM